MIILLSTLIICSIILNIYLYSKYKEYKNKWTYWCYQDRKFLNIINSEKLTDKEKIEAIEWEYDNVPF